MGIREPIGLWTWQPLANAAACMVTMLQNTDISAYDPDGNYEALVVGCAGRFEGVLARISVAPGVGKTRTLTLYKNGVSTGYVLTFSGATTEVRDDGYTLDCEPGDYLWWRASSSGTPAAPCKVQLAMWYQNTEPKRWWASSRVQAHNAAYYGAAFWSYTSGMPGELDYQKEPVALFDTTLREWRWWANSPIPVGLTLTFRIMVNYAVQATWTATAGESSGLWTGNIPISAGSHYNVLVTTSGATYYGFWCSAVFENVNDDELHAVLVSGGTAQSYGTSYLWQDLPCAYTYTSPESAVLSFVHKGMKVRGYGAFMDGNTYSTANRWYELWLCRQGDVNLRNMVLRYVGASTTSYPYYHWDRDVDHADDFVTALDWERLSIRFHRAVGDGTCWQNALRYSVWVEGGSAPTALVVTPDEATTLTTLDVVITGSNLGEVTNATFGAHIVVNSLTVDSDDQITINITTSSIPETVDIVLTNPTDSTTITDGFTVLPNPPIVMSVTPGSAVQGTVELPVVITGSAMTGATGVDFGSGITVVSYSVISDLEIDAILTISNGAEVGGRTVGVTTATGSGYCEGCFTVLPASSPPPGGGGKSDGWRGSIWGAGGQQLGSLGGWRKLIINRRVNAPDRILVELDGRHPATALLGTDTIVQFYRTNKALGIEPYKEAEGLCRGRYYDWDSKGQYRFTGEFLGYEDLLARRLLLGGVDEAFAASGLPAETVMKRVVSEQCGLTGTRAIRPVAIKGLTVENSLARGLAYTGYEKGMNLLDWLQQVAEARDMAFRVVMDSAPTTFKFRCQPNPYGADRTATSVVNGRNATGHIPVVLSEQRMNVAALGYHLLRDGEGNVAINDNQAYYLASPASTDSLWNDCEFRLSIPEGETPETAAARELSRMAAREETDIGIIQTRNCCYGRHYFLGDVVTVFVAAPGLERAVNKTIIAVTLTVERRQGQMDETVELTLADRPNPYVGAYQESLMNLSARLGRLERSV